MHTMHFHYLCVRVRYQRQFLGTARDAYFVLSFMTVNITPTPFLGSYILGGV